MATELNIQEYRQKIQALRSSVVELDQLASEYETKVTQSSAQLKEHLYEPIDALTRRFNDLANAALHVASAEEDKANLAKQLAAAEDVLHQSHNKASTCAQEVEKSLNLVLETVGQTYGDIGNLKDLIEGAGGKSKQELERVSELQSVIQGLVNEVSVLSAQATKEGNEAKALKKKEEKLEKEYHDSYTDANLLWKGIFLITDIDERLQDKERKAHDRAIKAGETAKLAEEAQHRAQSELESLSPLSPQLFGLKYQFDTFLTTLQRRLDNASKARDSVERLQQALSEAQKTAGTIQFEHNAPDFAKRILELQRLFSVAEDQACIESAWDQRPREIEQGLALVAQKLKERESQDS